MHNLRTLFAKQAKTDYSGVSGVKDLDNWAGTGQKVQDSGIPWMTKVVRNSGDGSR